MFTSPSKSHPLFYIEPSGFWKKNYHEESGFDFSKKMWENTKNRAADIFFLKKVPPVTYMALATGCGNKNYSSQKLRQADLSQFWHIELPPRRSLGKTELWLPNMPLLCLIWLPNHNQPVSKVTADQSFKRTAAVTIFCLKLFFYSGLLV
jgi:hypothetical protein